MVTTEVVQTVIAKAVELTDEESRRAVALYAILARDPSDFVDMVAEEESLPVLQVTRLMMITSNPKHDAETIELNKLGSEILTCEIESRVEIATKRNPQ